MAHGYVFHFFMPSAMDLFMLLILLHGAYRQTEIARLDTQVVGR